MLKRGIAGAPAILAAAIALACATVGVRDHGARETGRLFFWKVESTHPAGGSAHLLGSFHFGRPDFRFDPVVQDAFERSDALVMELDPAEATTEKTSALLQEMGRLPEGETLSDLLPPETYDALADALLVEAPPDLREHKFAQLLANAAQTLDERTANLARMQAQMACQPLKRLRRMLDIASIFEDLDIIQTGADAILNIKEDLIGPARQRKDTVISLADLLQEAIASMGLPGDVVRTLLSDDLPPVRADRAQLGRVFINLIKNGMEAMYEVEDKRLFIWARLADEPGFVVVDVTDNGCGIPPDQMDKIWVAFYTTKGDRGGTGLGLAACAQIIGQLGGKITVESDVGVGTTFSVFLPAAEE